MIHPNTPTCAAGHIKVGIRCQQCGDRDFRKEFYQLVDRRKYDTQRLFDRIKPIGVK